MKPRKSVFSMLHWEKVSLILLAYDFIMACCAFFAALWLRFDGSISSIPEGYLKTCLYFLPAYAIFCVILFKNFRLYNSIWRFASYKELVRVTQAISIAGVVHIVGTIVLARIIPDAIKRMPISYYLFGIVFQFVFTLGVRFSYRFVLLLRSISRKEQGNGVTARRVMLIGAGAAGQMILRDLHTAKESNERVCCIIDDNSNKWDRDIDGVPVVGGKESILEMVERYKIEKIFVAIPSATAEQKRDILNICKETGCELKNLPGMYQLTSGEITANALRDVAVEDLLGRDTVKVDMEEIFSFIKGKTILVTGGGGSIGSELCRQIAAHDPKKLLIFDVYENNAYDIQQELKKAYPQLDLVVLIGSVRDSRRINNVFATYRPDVVYHAAAHKHVPLMEQSPCEAIKNNAIGTYKTAYAAVMNGCKRFVLISTDKAVNPTNIMGASKRLCEMVIQCFDKKVKEGKALQMPQLVAHAYDAEASAGADQTIVPQTEFVAVRFGNVLGSNGSVIPLFKKQIEAGGPVTVTHPDIIRYFMTIPEAVSLVLQAGVYAAGGEIFVLDMGEPVKIDSLARNLIKLSGLKPDVDIKISYTGLRPGEKLYEEKLMEEEGMRTTPNQLIHIGNPIDFDADEFLVKLQELMHASYADHENIVQMVAEIVTTYHPTANQEKVLATTK